MLIVLGGSYRKCYVIIMNMHQTHLRGVDLNLLPILDALLSTKSVTQAARDVGLSQPAASRALGRLRDILGDPLLVRLGGAMALTPRARALQGPLRLAMDAAQAVYAPIFTDVSEVKRSIVIACSDAQALVLGPLIAARLARDAPNIHIQFENYTSDLITKMETGAVDFAFALSSSELPIGALSEFVMHDRLALVMRKGHPMANTPFTIEDYGRVDHVTISIFGDGRTPVDAILAQHAIKRRIGVTVSSFASALAIVGKTDLVTTISRRIALELESSFGLAIMDPPLERPEIETVLVWSIYQDSDPVLSWLRRVIIDAGAQLSIH
jgi:DNA-binding transcriptional LysR family regulator